MSTRISRATLIKGLGSLAALGFIYSRLTPKNPAPEVPVRMLGPSAGLGHQLRDGKLPLPAKDDPLLKTGVAIVGGGISGLSAAWWLKRNGYNDFLIFELEKEPGGNSACGRNSVSAYPWGAHYVPLPNIESKYVRMFFEELGIIRGYDQNHQPVYNELFLCHEPQERLFKDGIFQEGFVPRRGLHAQDKEQIAKFFSEIKQLRNAAGKDGKPAFAIPLDLSSQDPRFTELDAISMADWLSKNNYTSKPLLWYINYCCKDDYGSTIDNVSAWAGLHYFAGRRGTAANAEMNAVVTWPEGNAFLVQKMREKLEEHIHTGSASTTVCPGEESVANTLIKVDNGQPFSVQSNYTIFAAPRFIAKHVVKGLNSKYPKAPDYAPWLVANITVKSVPASRGVDLSWDNVSYYSPSIGYVVATHQNITTRRTNTVLTYYYPLSASEPKKARQELLATPASEWSRRIIADLESMNPGITEQIISIDIWPWGHGMVRPSVGFIWGSERKQMSQPSGRVFFAHSDMSGISNFEEAQYRGIEAAEKILSEVRRA